MKIVNHKFEKAINEYTSDSWYAIVEHEGNKFEVIIDRVPSERSTLYFRSYDTFYQRRL